MQDQRDLLDRHSFLSPLLAKVRRQRRKFPVFVAALVCACSELTLVGAVDLFAVIGCKPLTAISALFDVGFATPASVMRS